MKKTAVLYICHVIDDETKFRYFEMKRGADALGYDIFWAIDVKCVGANTEILDRYRKINQERLSR